MPLIDDQPHLGSWFLRIDRFSDVHVVAAQNKSQSCGLASIKMVAFKINKLRPGAAALQKERFIEKIYRQKAGETTHNWEQTGASPTVMLNVLNSLGIGVWKISHPPVNDVGTTIARSLGVDQFGLGATGINAIKRGAPVILGCHWAPGGGHAVVVDTVTHVPAIGTFAAICDPWDGNVHFEQIEAGQPFTYNPQNVKGVNFWGKTQNERVVNGKPQAYTGSDIGLIRVIIHRV